MFNLLWLSLIKLYNVKNREDEFELKYILDAKSSNSSMYFPARLSHFIIAISLSLKFSYQDTHGILHIFQLMAKLSSAFELNLFLKYTQYNHL